MRTGRIAALVEYPRNDAHRLIEECMIAANIAAARYLDRNHVPTLYRVHGMPEEDRLETLRQFLREFGLWLPPAGEVTAQHLRDLLQKLGDRPDALLVSTAVIRSMPQAVYQPGNIGHFGLALEHYAHFTSPIRRYPDLVVHRGIRQVLKGGDPQELVAWHGPFPMLGQDCSFRERRADEATRGAVAWLKCYYMQDRIGEEFDGIVSGVVDFGLFVQLDGLQVDGLLHVSALGQDYFARDRSGLSHDRPQLGQGLQARRPAARARVERVARRAPRRFRARRRHGNPQGGRDGRASRGGGADGRSGYLRPARRARAAVAKPRTRAARAARRRSRGRSTSPRSARWRNARASRSRRRPTRNSTSWPRVGATRASSPRSRPVPAIPRRSSRRRSKPPSGHRCCSCSTASRTRTISAPACVRRMRPGRCAVIVPRDRAAGLTPVVRKVAAGAAETVPLVSVVNLARTLRDLKDRGIWLVGTDDTASSALFEADLAGPLALVMGSEGEGMRRLTRECCDQLVSIPMAGAVESLNVSVAAGVALFEAVRQREAEERRGGSEQGIGGSEKSEVPAHWPPHYPLPPDHYPLSARSLAALADFRYPTRPATALLAPGDLCNSLLHRAFFVGQRQP